MKQATSSKSPPEEVKRVDLYDMIKGVGGVLGKKYTIEILTLLTKEPLRYKQLRRQLRCTDNTLTRRLRDMVKYGLIEMLPVTVGNRKAHEYVVAEGGQELIGFFKKYEILANDVGS